MKFTGSVKKGKLTLHDKEGFKRSLSRFEGEVWIEIKSAPKARSPKQNGYYRYIIRELANEFGYTENEMHKVVKNHFNISSTKDLSIAEFSEYLDNIIIHFAQMGYPLQDPRGR